MVELLESSPHILDKNNLLENLIERERLETTGIGDGIALPHARTDSVSQLVIGFGRSDQGIEYDSLDGNLGSSPLFYRCTQDFLNKGSKIPGENISASQ